MCQIINITSSICNITIIIHDPPLSHSLSVPHFLPCFPSFSVTFFLAFSNWSWSWVRTYSFEGVASSSCFDIQRFVVEIWDLIDEDEYGRTRENKMSNAEYWNQQLNLKWSNYIFSRERKRKKVESVSWSRLLWNNTTP